MTRLMYFTADWCAPCRAFGPLLAREAQARGLDVHRINLDEPIADGLTVRHGVTSVPTVIALRDGEPVDRFGALPPTALRERLDALTA